MLKSEVEKYFKLNEKKKEIDSSMKDLKTKLSKEMLDTNNDVIVKGDYTVTYKPSTSYSVDNEKLVDKVVDYAQNLPEEERMKVLACLETKVVINEDILESLIYNGVVPEFIGSDCTTAKTTYRFMVKKSKSK